MRTSQWHGLCGLMLPQSVALDAVRQSERRDWKWSSIGGTPITKPALKPAAKFIRDPLQSGVDVVRIVSKQYREATQATKEQSRSFLPVNAERALLDFESDAYLVIESPTFKEGNKWKFFDGHSSFYANMDDLEFKAKIDDGSVRFGKGDVLKVRMQMTQTGTLDTLKLERAIVKVYDHRPSAQQTTLFQQ